MRTTSGVHIVASGHAMDDVPEMIQESLEFLRRHRKELRRLASFVGVEGACLDFGVRRRNVIVQGESFPAELVRLAGQIGLDLDITYYPMPMKHFVNLLDLRVDEVQAIFDHAASLKSEWKLGRRSPILAGKTLVQVFEKPSLRTRVSFEAAMQQLGGSGTFLSSQDAGLGGRESIEDVARVLTSYCDVLVLRTFSHELIETFARVGRCPVVNGLSDVSHPCQALTDLFTMQEVCGALEGKTLAYVGDGNNVAVSLAEACAMLGVAFVIGAPKGYELKPTFVPGLKQRFPKCRLTETTDPKAAVKHADVIYTDVWASMGQEQEKEARAKVFADYQVNAKLLKAAPKHAKFMHCLPARRGLEVTDDVMESPQSVVFQQAENRMHLAKGLFVWQLT